MLLKKETDVYVYAFNHRTSGSPWPEWAGDALHGYEIDHVFGVPHRADSRNKYSNEERTLSDQIMTYWTNFAKTGYVKEMSCRTPSPFCTGRSNFHIGPHRDMDIPYRTAVR